MFTAKYTFVTFVINMFEYVSVVNFSGSGFFSSRIITDMESTYLVPGTIDIGNDITFSYLLVIHIIDDLTGRAVYCTTYHIGLRYTSQEKSRVIPPVQWFEDYSDAIFLCNITQFTHRIDDISCLIIKLKAFVIPAGYHKRMCSTSTFCCFYSFI